VNIVFFFCIDGIRTDKCSFALVGSEKTSVLLHWWDQNRQVFLTVGLRNGIRRHFS